MKKSEELKDFTTDSLLKELIARNKQGFSEFITGKIILTMQQDGPDVIVKSRPVDDDEELESKIEVRFTGSYLVSHEKPQAIISKNTFTNFAWWVFK